MSKKSTEDALNSFFRREAKKLENEHKPKRKNGKPEFNLTVQPCMRWLKTQGFSMNKIEAKAVWSESAGRYLSGQTDVGVADAFGCCPDGTAAFIEFKAPGKRSTLKPHQKDWLLEKVELGCFAVCTDSVENLNVQWISFQALRKTNHHREYLRAQLNLPQARSRSDGPASLF